MANKQRLIDADALDNELEALKVRFKALGRDNVVDDYNFVQTVLLTAPTVDAVEVVRCKDCKSWNREDESGGMCTVDVAPVDTEIDGVWRLPCDFCSYGERRADNGMVD